jgi:hypothetical protein
VFEHLAKICYYCYFVTHVSQVQMTSEVYQNKDNVYNFIMYKNFP